MSRFPEVRRDIAIIVDQIVTASALRQCIQVGICDYRGDFNYDIGVRIQSGHFQIDPDEVAGTLH